MVVASVAAPAAIFMEGEVLSLVTEVVNEVVSDGVTRGVDEEGVGM